MSEKIRIDAIIDASPEKAWDYYTEPQHITKWNFADPSWHCPSASNDMRVGGLYSARMEAKDGSFGFDLNATYEDVQKGKEFTFALEDGRKVKVQFIPADEKTELIVEFDPEQQNTRERQRDGWNAILQNYKSYTESN